MFSGGFYCIYLCNIEDIKRDDGLSYNPISVFPSYDKAVQHVKDCGWISNNHLIVYVCWSLNGNCRIYLVLDGLFVQEYYGKINTSASFKPSTASPWVGRGGGLSDYSTLPYFRSS